MIRNISSGVALAAIAAVVGGVTWVDAIAQEKEPAKVSGQLEDIVISATKRETTLHDTPISVTAVTGDEILERGLSDFTALAQSVPGISMRSSGPGQTEFEMRGLSSAGGNSSTVGFYLDDTPLTAPAAGNNGKVVIDPGLYDLSHVEVLRGPQGTLYGSGSMGGTIKLVPNPPNLTALEASAEAIVSDTRGGGFNHGENAMVNLPFGGGTVALRIVGSESHDSGWIDRVVIADGLYPVATDGGVTRGDVLGAPVAARRKGVNNEDIAAVRASLLWQPTDGLSIRPSFLHQRIQQDGLSVIDSVPGTNAHYQPFDTAEPFSDSFDLGSLNIQYRFRSFDLNSTTSYWSRDQHLRQDGSEEWQVAFGLPMYSSQGGLGASSPTPLENDKSKQTSEELRLTSSTDSKFKWMVGYFYENFKSEWNLHIYFPDAAPIFGTATAYSQTQPTTIVQRSFFGQASYQLTPKLRVTTGLRRYSYDAAVATAVSGFGGPTGSDTIANSASSERSTGFNPKVDLSYEMSKDLLLYATAAKGFRPGGANEPIPTSGPLGTICEANLQTVHGTSSFVPSPETFDPDNVWSYELGEKLRALGGRLTVNGAVYVENWGGMQQQISLPCGFFYQANVGEARIYGSELEINSALGPDFMLSANGGYTHATVASTTLPGAGITPGIRIQNVPDWTSSVSLAYRHRISNQLAFKARIENSYVGVRTDSTYAVNRLSSYDLTNIRAGVESDRWSAVLFARNVFNQRALLTNTTQISINIPTFNRVAVSQPLTVGVDFNYQFGR